MILPRKLKICVPVNIKNPRIFLKNFLDAQKRSDFTELWLDNFSAKTLAIMIPEIFRHQQKPIIYKNTSGNLAGFPADLIPAKQYFAFIDFDFGISAQKLKNFRRIFPKTKLILSFHDFTKTPDRKNLQNIIAKMEKKGADIYKIATSAQNPADSLMILTLCEKLSLEGKKCICLCMGKHGTLTRVAGHLFGNFLTFAALNEQQKTAPGQLTVKELNLIYQQTP